MSAKTKRKVLYKAVGYKTQDGAGVKLIRVLGSSTVKEFDPFLMLDSFDSTNPDDYTAGFPMHPHRGMETISFVSQGKMQHKDTMGFEDTITDGEVQFMTAGSGVEHEELIPATERLRGLQLWLNLPAAQKMVPPEYHAIKCSDIEEIPFEGELLRLLIGNYREHKGYQTKYLPFDYYDIHLNAGGSITIDTDSNRSCMIFTLSGKVVIEGEIIFDKTAVKLSQGDSVTISSLGSAAEVMFMSSVAINEHVYWGGPVVMDSMDNLYLAFKEMADGTFLKSAVHYD